MAKQLDFMETLDAAERSPQLPAPATLARSTDPQSSYDAAARAVESGAIKANWSIIAAAVRIKANQGLDSRQLADRIGMDRHEVARRVPEMVERKILYRPCPSSGPLTIYPGERIDDV
jgi:hypothetical protein